ncbi:Yippee/Mis18 [Phakopsora pachyrhizi]|uniref:Protein yippee-like n=1 Tax=Phakopsora pachyrhizi TaxID=170000 RepID=A0AAV0BJ31_PHAPC|nr:Yippee/Mis18 [Phakopsora pachyrhizi]CAH7686958.1 Yippee/Mis18 [Phakopsora pachyrhizi]
MGLQHREYLSCSRVFGCSNCRTHLTTIDNMLSRQFNGQHGRAYLFSTAVNIKFGQPEDRPMTTGLHTVRDIYCSKCDTVLGWKYERAYEPSQKYKEGKVILEKALLVDVN